MTHPVNDPTTLSIDAQVAWLMQGTNYGDEETKRQMTRELRERLETRHDRIARIPIEKIAAVSLAVHGRRPCRRSSAMSAFISKSAAPPCAASWTPISRAYARSTYERHRRAAA